jgi:hypothetical protein
VFRYSPNIYQHVAARRQYETGNYQAITLAKAQTTSSQGTTASESFAIPAVSHADSIMEFVLSFEDWSSLIWISR